MGKITSTLTLTLIIIIGLTSHSYGIDSQIHITVDNHKITKGEVFNVGINAEDIKEIYGLEVNLKYDNKYLEPLDNDFKVNSNLDKNNYFNPINSIDKNRSLIRFMGTSLGRSSFDINDDILHISFKAIKTGATKLEFDKIKILKKDLTKIKATCVDKDVFIESKRNNSEASNSNNTISNSKNNNKDENSDINSINNMGIIISSEYVDNLTVEQIDIHKTPNDILTPVSNIFYLSYKNSIEDNQNNKPIYVTITYDGLNDGLKKIEEDKLGIYRLNENKNRWIYLGGDINRDTNSISVNIKPPIKLAVFQVPFLNDLKDIKKHWSNEYIKPLLGMGIISGYDDKSFKPNNNINRIEFSKIISKALDLNISDKEIVLSDYNDIPNWAKDYVVLSCSNSILSGYEDGTFRPNNEMTRAELAVAISRLLPKYESKDTLDFKDNNDIPSWAQDAMKICIQNDILNGYQDNTIRPNDYVTRAEACKVIYMLLIKLKIF